MDDSAQATVTRLLSELQSGRTDVINELFERVYETLRNLARDQRQSWDGDFTLNTTALVHEAYLKLVDQTRVEFSTRAHFLNVAAKVMRHLLVDYARQRGAQKRGGDAPKISLEEGLTAIVTEIVITPERSEELISLDNALTKLALINEREAQVVECRFFGGMSLKETAAVLDVSPTTVKRDWSFALAWLRREMLEGEN